MGRDMYRSTTEGVRVTVEPVFLDSESDPDRSYYFWAYTIEILNLGADTVQLLHRHWEIVGETGEAQVVDGRGVVGEEPILEPGEAFEYTSGTPLATPSGVMRGHYTMIRPDGSGFEVAIPAFSLDSPHAARMPN